MILNIKSSIFFTNFYFESTTLLSTNTDSHHTYLRQAVLCQIQNCLQEQQPPSYSFTPDLTIPQLSCRFNFFWRCAIQYPSPRNPTGCICKSQFFQKHLVSQKNHLKNLIIKKFEKRKIFFFVDKHGVFMYNMSCVKDMGQEKRWKIPDSGVWLSLARALDLGSRGRRFESCHPDLDTLKI